MSFGAGLKDVWLIRTGATGDTVWTRTFGGANNDKAYSVVQTADGGYIILGATYSFSAGSSDAWLIKTDANGDTTWVRTYGGADYDRGNSVAQTTDGGYIIAGETESFGAGEDDVWLIKTDASGDTVWTHTYGGTARDLGYSVTQTTDDGYIVAGRTSSSGAGCDVLLIKTDKYGDTMWTRTYGGAWPDIGYSVAQTADGGYVIAGYTGSFGAGESDVYLIKTDAAGDTMWTRTWGDAYNDYGRSVAQTADGGYIIAGLTETYRASMADVYLIKTDSAGNSPAIAEPQPPVAHEPTGATIAHAVLRVPESAIRHLTLALLNCTGRKVMDLQPGENDIRQVSPGIYFVHSTFGNRQSPMVTKVTVTR
jgi:hypothetical protein